MEWLTLGFLDMVTQQSVFLVIYYNLVLGVGLGIMVVIVGFLLSFLLSSILLGGKHYYFGHSCEWLEFIWGIRPPIILIFLGYISVGNIYSGQPGKYIQNRLRITAHQWYWSYEYRVSKTLLRALYLREGVLCEGYSEVRHFDYLNYSIVKYSNSNNNFILFWCGNLFFSEWGYDGSSFRGKKGRRWFSSIFSPRWWYGDWYSNEKRYVRFDRRASHLFYDSFSLMQTEEEFGFGRLLQEPNTMVLLPTHVKNVVIISSADVIHRWGVPALGIKIDAVPRRANSFKVVGEREGVFGGFCYELCGPEHSIIKITCGMVRLETYYDWLIYCVAKDSYFAGPRLLVHRESSNHSSVKDSKLENFIWCTWFYLYLLRYVLPFKKYAVRLGIFAFGK